MELLSLLVTVALAPLFYWRLLVTDPQSAAVLASGDLTELHYPYRRWVAEQLARGVAPWWNPYVFGGESAIGDVQYHVLYPPDRWLAQLAGGGFPFQALEIGIVAHVALAAVFTYLLARRLSGSRVGGLIGAIVFAFGGYLASYPVQQMIILETSVWLPLVLWSIDLGADSGSLAPYVVGAAGLALAALAGHPQTLFYVSLAAVLYALFKAWKARHGPLVPLLGLAVLGLGALGLAASALVPAFAHLALTDRTGVDYAFTTSGFQLREVIGLVFPQGVGAVALYGGTFTLVLAAIALASPVRRWNKGFWVALGIGGLLFSFGGNTFLQGPLYLALGSFRFRDHERLAMYVSLALAILAAYGAAELTRPWTLPLGWLWRAVRWPILALLVAGLYLLGLAASNPGNLPALAPTLDRLAFTALVLTLGLVLVGARERGRLGPAVVGLLAVLLVGFDLFSTNWQNNLQPGDPQQELAASPIAQYLESYGTGLFRISSEGLLPGDGNAGMLFRLADVTGNSPLETRDAADFERLVPELTRWQVLDVRYIVTERNLNDPRFQLLLKDGRRNLYELAPRLQLPRAFVVDQAQLAPSHAAALAMLANVDVQTTAVIEGMPALPRNLLATTPGPAAAPTADPTPGVVGQPANLVQVVQDDGNDAVVDATLRLPGVLVLGDADYPGWTATVDGRSAPIYPADGLVRAVVLPAGRHVVRFHFTPPGFATGSALSAETWDLLRDLVAAELLLRLVGLLARFGWRRYRARQHPRLAD